MGPDQEQSLSEVLKNSFWQKLPNTLRASKKPSYGWSGDYSSWDAARAETDGYEQANILAKTKQSLAEIKSGKAVFERDSVLFSQKEYPFPLISCLLHIASANDGCLHVVDFGGSLGSTWFQTKDFLSHLKEVSWHVVEQENYVTVGKSDFEDNILKFHYTLEESLAAVQPNVIVLSSVVQYLDEPHRFLTELVKLRPAYIVIDRTAIINEGGDRLTVQRVNPAIYDASYPAWFFNKERFLAHFSDYTCLAEFSSYVESEVTLCIDGKPMAKDKGFFLKRTL